MPWLLFPRKRPTLSKTALDLLLLLGLMALFYGRSLLGPDKMSYGGDAMSLFLPALEHYSQALLNGTLPLWNSGAWLGAPFLATFQAGALYPPQILSIFFDTPMAAQSFLLFLSLTWLAWGAYYFGLRALALERNASLLMAIIMGCSGFVGGHMDHVNQIAAISWIPWIMAEALILLRHPRLKDASLLALFLAMQILAGHPQYVAYSALYLLGLVICYSVYYYHRRKSSDPPQWIGIVLIGVAVVVAGGLGAAQILPSSELSKRSLRPLDPPGRAFVGSFPPRHLLTLVAPHAYGNPRDGLHTAFDDGREGAEFNYDYKYDEFVCYVGLVTLALALLAVATLIRESIVRAFTILALMSLLIASGAYFVNGAPYRFIMSWLPGGGGFRVPARFLIFFVLSVSVLAAVGLNQIVYYLRTSRRIRPSTLRGIIFLILVLVLFDLNWFSRTQTFRDRDTTAVLRERGDGVPFLLSRAGEHRIFRIMSEVPYDLGESEAWRNPEARAEIRKIGPKLQVQRMQYNLQTLWGLRVCKGYEEGLLPTLNYLAFMGYDNPNYRKGRYTSNLNSSIPDTALLGLLNVRYLLADKPVAGDRLELIKEYEFIPGDSEFAFIAKNVPFDPNFRRFAIYENLDCLPKFLWGDRLRALCDLGALDIIPRKESLVQTNVQQRLFNYRIPENPVELTSATQDAPTTATLFAKAPFPDLIGRDQGLSVKRIEGSPNGFIVKKTAESKGEIILLEAPYPGWVCRWEGQSEPMPVRRVNSIMMGCEVPVGPTALRFIYEPFSFRLGLFISCCFVLLMTCALFFPHFPENLKKRKGTLAS